MIEVNILYDIEHFEYSRLAIHTARDVEEKCKIKINLEILDPIKVLDSLSSNPNYDFVIIHLLGLSEEAYKIAEKCRRLTDGKLVAESTSIGYQNEFKIKSYFDDFIRPIYDINNLENLLRRHHFI